MRIRSLQVAITSFLYFINSTQAFTGKAFNRKELSLPSTHTTVTRRFVGKPLPSQAAESGGPIENQMPTTEYFHEGNNNRPTLKFRECSPWIAVFVVFLWTNFRNTHPSLSVLPGGQDLAYSTISASLLRTSAKSKRRFNVQNVLITAVLLWQILKGGRLLTAIPQLLSNFSTWYMGILAAFPLYTKSLTTMVISLTGDTAAQIFEERIRAKKDQTKFNFIRNYDRRRGLAILADAIFVTGPLLHFSYGWLENTIPVAGAGSASLAALSHVLIDDIFLDSIFVAIMFVTTGIAEGYSIKQIIPQFKKDYFKAVKTGLTTSFMLMPLEFICFRFLPLSLRVLGINLIDIIWEAAVSYMVHLRRRGAMKELIEEEEDMIPPESLTSSGPMISPEPAFQY